MNEYTTRIYKYNINLLFYKYSGDSKAYQMKKGWRPVVKGLPYSLLTLIFGFIGHSGRRASLDAIAINTEGGLDYTKEMTEMEFDRKTVYVYNNLPRQTLSKLKIADVDILIELQSRYLKSEQPQNEQENRDYLTLQLRKININNLDNLDFDNFFAAFNNIHIQQNHND